MDPTTLSTTPTPATFDADSPLIMRALAATRAAAVAAAKWAGRGDPHAADGAATDAMRAWLAGIAAEGTVITGEGAKDGAPMLADGESIGGGPSDTGYARGSAVERFDIAVDPLECTELCANGLPGALSTIALAPSGSLWSPGPAYYMDKLVLPAAARDAAQLVDPPEVIAECVAAALGRPLADLRVVVLDKPRHGELIARLRTLGVVVSTPTAGDVAGALQVLLPGGEADLLLGVGGTPEGVMTACAAFALGGGMQGRLAPQRDDERLRIAQTGLTIAHVFELDELASPEGAFIATGVTGGSLLAAPVIESGWVTTESLVIAAGVVRRIRQTSPTEE
jgi:fructose-1,6-bisphosphatase II